MCIRDSIISEALVLKENLPTPPPPITLPTAEGPRLFPVLAVFYDYSSDQGSVFISDDLYVELWDDPRTSAVGLFVACLLYTSSPEGASHSRKWEAPNQYENCTTFV